jgi:hypothetical protein
MSMLLMPMGMVWVAATLAGWSWLRHAQGLVGSWMGGGLVPDTSYRMGADTPRPGWFGEGEGADLVPARFPRAAI